MKVWILLLSIICISYCQYGGGYGNSGYGNGGYGNGNGYGNNGYGGYNQQKLTPNDLLGNYMLGNQCVTAACPTTYSYDRQSDFSCPLAGYNGTIGYDNQSQQYYIYLKTYHVIADNGQFWAYFNFNNILYDQASGMSQLQIPLANGYTLNIMPCYDYSTSKVCSGYGPKELAVWKTDRYRQAPEGCLFSMKPY